MELSKLDASLSEGTASFKLIRSTVEEKFLINPYLMSMSMSYCIMEVEKNVKKKNENWLLIVAAQLRMVKHVIKRNDSYVYNNFFKNNINVDLFFDNFYSLVKRDGVMPKHELKIIKKLLIQSGKHKPDGYSYLELANLKNFNTSSKTDGSYYNFDNEMLKKYQLVSKDIFYEGVIVNNLKMNHKNYYDSFRNWNQTFFGLIGSKIDNGSEQMDDTILQLYAYKITLEKFDMYYFNNAITSIIDLDDSFDYIFTHLYDFNELPGNEIMYLSELCKDIVIEHNVKDMVSDASDKILEDLVK